jgi:hypothetical protein
MHERERFEWARAWSLRQSFGPWAYHHGVGKEPEDWCDECRVTYDLGVAMGTIRDELERENGEA